MDKYIVISKSKLKDLREFFHKIGGEGGLNSAAEKLGVSRSTIQKVFIKGHEGRISRDLYIKAILKYNFPDLNIEKEVFIGPHNVTELYEKSKFLNFLFGKSTILDLAIVNDKIFLIRELRGPLILGGLALNFLKFLNIHSILIYNTSIRFKLIKVSDIDAKNHRVSLSLKGIAKLPKARIGEKAGEVKVKGNINRKTLIQETRKALEVDKLENKIDKLENKLDLILEKINQ